MMREYEIVPAMPTLSETASAGRDRFRLKAAEFRTLAERAKDPVIAEGYRRLAEGYESLASHCKPPPRPDNKINR